MKKIRSGLGLGPCINSKWSYCFFALDLQSLDFGAFSTTADLREVIYEDRVHAHKAKR